MPTTSKPCFCCGACCGKTDGEMPPDRAPAATIDISGDTGGYVPIWSKKLRPTANRLFKFSTITFNNPTNCDQSVWLRF